jgi:predicted DNA-binding transcriptional regulator AlpA
MHVKISVRTVKLIKRVLLPWMQEDVISNSEYWEVIRQLKNLSEKGMVAPVTPNRLIDRKELCSILGLSLSNLKRLEKNGGVNIPIIRLGSTLRYRLHDVLRFIEEFQTEA